MIAMRVTVTRYHSYAYIHGIFNTVSTGLEKHKQYRYTTNKNSTLLFVTCYDVKSLAVVKEPERN